MRVHGLPPADCPAPGDPGPGCILRTPATLTGAMVDVLRTYFGSVHRATLERAAFLWHPDPAKSLLYVADEFNWDLANVGQRPGIVVSLDDIMVGDGSRTIGRSGLSGHDPATGANRMSSRESGGFTLQCIAKHKLEAWSLAWEVKTFLQSYAYEIGRAYRFGSLSVAGIRKPAPLGEGAKQHMSAAVGVAFHMVSSFEVAKEGLPATMGRVDVEIR